MLARPVSFCPLLTRCVSDEGDYPVVCLRDAGDAARPLTLPVLSGAGAVRSRLPAIEAVFVLFPCFCTLRMEVW